MFLCLGFVLSDWDWSLGLALMVFRYGLSFVDSFSAPQHLALPSVTPSQLARDPLFFSSSVESFVAGDLLVDPSNGGSFNPVGIYSSCVCCDE